MTINKKPLLFSCFVLSGLIGIAQAQETVQMADTMRSNGKIYVVVAVIVTLFIGFILYLLRLDRKISALEKETK